MKPVAVDQGYSVMILAFLVHATADGVAHSIGIIGTQLIERRNYTREDIAWMSTLFWSSFKLSSWFGSFLYTTFGCRVPVIFGSVTFTIGLLIPAFFNQEIYVIFLCVGVISGIGFGAMYVPTWITANTYYNKKRQLANGLVMSGSAVGLVLFAPLIDILLEVYGLQGTFMILAGILLNMTLVGALIPPLKTMDPERTHLLAELEEVDQESENSGFDQKSTASKEGYGGVTFLSLLAVDLLRNWKYSFYVVASCLTDPITLHTLFTYLPDYVVQAGYPNSMTWQPIAVSGATGAAARLSMGFSNKPRAVIISLYALASLLVGIPLLLYVLPFCADHYLLICFCAGVYGFGKGLFWSLKGPVLAEIVDLDDFDRGLGTDQTFSGFFMLLCPLQGKIYDVTGEYFGTFMLSGTMATVGGIFLLAVARSVYRMSRPEPKMQTQYRK